MESFSTQPEAMTWTVLPSPFIVRTYAVLQDLGFGACFCLCVSVSYGHGHGFTFPEVVKQW